MIDFNTCRKCGGKVHPAETDESGEMTVRPSVMCRITDDLMLMNDDPPPGCPYDLEHRMICQNVPPEFADHMSGGKRNEAYIRGC